MDARAIVDDIKIIKRERERETQRERENWLLENLFFLQFLDVHKIESSGTLSPFDCPQFAKDAFPQPLVDHFPFEQRESGGPPSSLGCPQLIERSEGIAD
ncbi:hypothetical protein H5410_036154 [Solanum commersonii]|uniref:Uncharacterized protein n=1 Tax=Solanum commersonii TaxID=4109 RepID=A0A9J5Y4K4_SOLCO|nr:hypothetical protein H5410_036154 [Solanum commersonii]